MFIVFDALIVVVSYTGALGLRFDGRVPDDYLTRFIAVAPLLVVLYLAMNSLFGMYWRSWRYAGLHDALGLGQAVGLSTVVVFLCDALLLGRPLPLGVVPVAGTFVLAGMGIARFLHRLVQEAIPLVKRRSQTRMLIVGAGQAGQWLAHELRCTPAMGYRPVCFVDDDPGKQGQRIHGLHVAGTRHDIQRLVQEHDVEVILFAIPSLDNERRREILVHCQETSARIKMVPSILEMLRERAATPLFRDVRIEDLLGRPPVVFSERTYDGALGHTVLVTGAAGSIGSELARQIARSGAAQLVLLDTNETGLFDLAAELESSTRHKPVRIETVVASVTHASAVRRVFARYQPRAIFHAAAYKHVPLMEAHPEEAVFTNIIGTHNVCRSADEFSCDRMVFISTDKAVDPANVMGATKRVGERIIEAFALDSPTVYCAVRFGNVLGSRGSVVPTFERQIRQGGPVTITHPEMTRFFMTIPEAVNLIIEASCQARGGEVFVLDMGEPVPILALAHKLIRLHGLRPGADVEIQEIGLRPGEKLHEALTDAGEVLLPTTHPRVRRVLAREGAALRRAEVGQVVMGLSALAHSDSTTNALVDALFSVAREAPAYARAS